MGEQKAKKLEFTDTVDLLCSARALAGKSGPHAAVLCTQGGGYKLAIKLSGVL